ncbi:hypothetical protein ASPCADRAFT_204116 [Aspergillus carbonarius ITEM 5010]|uniref:Uncharacterized protein n=1 Tax=Aspergillus carbonarius (strain ITEM 5010) TaxID=602072 RepID=A0A1R3S0D0_ASPC5|nr:hypothetical protein ASPCADRAFT_204116 [Aspergillus carbonarius ITEM 5010]
MRAFRSKKSKGQDAVGIYIVKSVTFGKPVADLNSIHREPCDEKDRFLKGAGRQDMAMHL